MRSRRMCHFLIRSFLFPCATAFSLLIATAPGSSESSQAQSGKTPSQTESKDFTASDPARELLVKCDVSRMAPLIQTLESDGWHVIQVLPQSGVLHLRIPEGMNRLEAIELLESYPEIEYAEPNHRIRPLNQPNDPYFPRQWGLHNTGQDANGAPGTADADVDAPEAWEFRTGSVDVVVAVIDTGVDYHHPDLEANIWRNPGEIEGNGLDDDGNGYVDDVVGWDFVDEDADPADAYQLGSETGHGTQVAGTVAAVGNNAVGVAGLNWVSQVMVLRIMDAFGNGDTADAVRAVAYANQMGADVITMSWEDDGFSQSLKEAIAASEAVVVCGAGNAGTDNDTTPLYPASYDSPNIISVAASDPDDALPAWSNFGSTSVDVAAPGENIYTTIALRKSHWLDTFDDGDISNWATGGVNNSWGTTTEQADSGTHSLTESPAPPPGLHYLPGTDSWARAPALDLSQLSGTQLSFSLRGKSEFLDDVLTLQISSDGTTWSDQIVYQFPFFWDGLDAVSGGIGIWLPFSVDLGPLDGQSTVYIRFRFTSDADGSTEDGWYIDDVEVSALSSDYDGASEYGYQGGTSMSVPHVAGLAALIKAHKPSLSNLEIKGVIEQTVDKLPAFTGKVATGGRVNAAKAMDELYDPWLGPSTGCFLSVLSEE